MEIARSIGDKTEVDKLYTGLGKIYLKQKNYQQAEKFLDSALTLSQNTGDKKLTENAYDLLAKLDSATGNYKAAYEDHKKYTLYYDSIVNRESVNKTIQLEAGYDFQKREDSLKTLQEKTNIIKAAEIKRKSILTYSMIVILLLVLVLATLLINRQQIKYRKDKIILEKEKQRVEGELSNARILLREYVNSIVEKTNLLEQVNFEMEELRNLKSKELDEKRVDQIEKLQKLTILTEADWDKFKELFEKVHQGFFIRLKEKMPDITQAEMRLVSLAKLNLDSKQMAKILGVSLNTLRTSRYRLRKKFDLSEDDSIDIIANSI